jgi:hypothetical protein
VHKGDPELRCRSVQRYHREFNVWVADRAKDGHAFEIRYDFLENLQSLSVCLRGSFEDYAGHVSAGIPEALDEPNLHRCTN